MNYVDVVAMPAVLQYLFFGGQVGMARSQHGVKAPAVTGDVLSIGLEPLPCRVLRKVG